jgi:spore coat protein U-like protein
MMSKILLVILSLWFGLHDDSHAMGDDDCEVSIISIGNIYWDEDIGGYNPLSNETNSLTESVSVFNASDNKCDFHLTASSVNYNGRPQERIAVKGDEEISYYLATAESTEDKRQWWDYPDAKNDKKQVLSDDIRGEQGTTLPFYMIVPAGQQVSSGLYTDSSQVQIWKGKHQKNREPDSDDLSDSAFIQITIPVLFFSAINFEFFNGGNEYYADLGIIENGAKHEFTMWVTHSVPFNIEARSLNNGVLKSTVGSQTIPYVFRYGSRVIPLDSGMTILAENQSSTFLRAYPLSVSVEQSTRGLGQGEYSDKIFIDLVSL